MAIRGEQGVIRAVLFDVDGTLIDSNDLHAEAWAKAFAHFGLDIPQHVVRGQIGKGGDNLLPALLPPDVPESRRTEIEDYRGALFKRDFLPRVTAFPDVVPLFERVRADGSRIILATSSKSEELERYVALIGCRDLIDETVTKDDVEHSKPDPDIFAAALHKAGCQAAEALVVGDTPYDVEAAAKIGIATIALRCGGFAEAALREAGAIALFDDPADLLRQYAGSPLGR